MHLLALKSFHHRPILSCCKLLLWPRNFGSRYQCSCPSMTARSHNAVTLESQIGREICLQCSIIKILIFGTNDSMIVSHVSLSVDLSVEVWKTESQLTFPLGPLTPFSPFKSQTKVILGRKHEYEKMCRGNEIFKAVPVNLQLLGFPGFLCHPAQGKCILKETNKKKLK